jgi:hypothetical protein
MTSSNCLLYTGGAASGDLYMFDLKNKTWAVVNATGDGPGALHGHGLAAVGDRLFLFGGYRLTENHDVLSRQSLILMFCCRYFLVTVL